MQIFTERRSIRAEGEMATRTSKDTDHKETMTAAEEKPKTRRCRTVKKADGAAENGPDAKSEDKPKRRTSTTRKTAAKKSASSAESKKAAAADADGKTMEKKTTRRTTRKSTSTAKSSGTRTAARRSSSAAEDTAERKTTRRRTAHKVVAEGITETAPEREAAAADNERAAIESDANAVKAEMMAEDTEQGVIFSSAHRDDAASEMAAEAPAGPQDTSEEHGLTADTADREDAAEALPQESAPEEADDGGQHYDHHDHHEHHDGHEHHDHHDRSGEHSREHNNEDRPVVSGILDLADGGFGFLRAEDFRSTDQDIYVSPTQIRRFNLKTGDEITGISRRPGPNEKFGALLYVNEVNGRDLSEAIHRPQFESLTPIFPNERMRLEGGGSNDLSVRLIDLIAPIGRGQRGMIVAPPKAGKTTLLKNIARSIEDNYPDTVLYVLLIDERPEEVTDMKRTLKRGQVISSTFDELPAHHVKVTEMMLARAKRLAEHGMDVVILLDSLTRLTRAYNLYIPASGRTLSGGIDPGAFYGPKRFFGAARNIEDGGSITILATALVDTGSRMDDVIFEEFKGTGNMELHLDRKMSEKRIFPAIDINKSGTRREELLMDKDELEAIWTMRRAIANQSAQDVTEEVLNNLSHTKNNRDFIEIIRKIFHQEK